jgi:hypothetical protein
MAGRRRFPAFGWVGLGLVAVGWPASWLLPGRPTLWSFTVLWVGYCLVVEGLAYLRHGTCHITSSPARYLLYFALSAPMWFLFEAINLRVANWAYVDTAGIPPVVTVVARLLAFSTVAPAILGTAALLRSHRPESHVDRRLRLRPRTEAALIAGGMLLLAFALAVPRIGFPCVWLFLIPLLEPVNLRLGAGSVIETVARRSFGLVASLAGAALICGFLWEFWNYWSNPKWVYDIPFFSHPSLFEMPLPGYLGYPFFALEVYAVVQLGLAILARMRRRSTADAAVL